MVAKRLSWLVVLCLVAGAGKAAESQEARLWGVDGLTKILRDTPVPSSPETEGLIE